MVNENKDKLKNTKFTITFELECTNNGKYSVLGKIQELLKKECYAIHKLELEAFNSNSKNLTEFKKRKGCKQ